MKKVLLLLIITCVAFMAANAQLGVGQQIPNNNFESWTTEATGSQYARPASWHSINDATGSTIWALVTIKLWEQARDENFVKKHNRGSSQNPDYCVKLTTRKVWGTIANGSLTTGRFHAGSSTASNTANCTYTSTVSGFNVPITSYPDSLYYRLMTKMASSNSKAHVKVVFHNNSVASNNAIYQDPNPTSASNSVVNTSGTVNSAKEVAVATDDYSSHNSWTLRKIPFTYTSNNTTPSFVLATFATNGTASAGSEGDEAYFDDVVLIYNTRLASLKVNGTDIAGFNPDVLTYTYPLSSCNQFPTVTATAKSAHATATISHPATTAEPYTIIKVTHKNQENDENVTKYYRINYTMPSANITLSNSGTYTVCAGEEVTMTASGANSYTWSNDLGGGATKTVTPTSSTQYTVSGTDANGCQGTAIAYITVNPLPQFNITGNTTICSGNQTTLTANNSALSYTWSTNETTTSINVSTAADYSVVGKDPNTNCTTTKTITVTSSETPTITINGSSTVCSGSAITLTAESSVANTGFVWTTPDNQQVSGSQIEVSQGGTYTVAGTAGGCTGSASKQISVSTTPTVTISGPNVVCGNDAITLTASSNIANTTFTWSDANTTQGATLNVDQAGTFTVSGSANGCTSTAEKQISASTIPDKPVTTGAGSCGAGEVTLGIVSPSTDLTYNWYATQESQNIIYTGATYTLGVNGTATYYVSAVNAAGCESERETATATVTPIPAQPTVSDTAVCGESDITLSASSANTVTWYSDQQATTTVVTSQHITADTAFYAVAKNGNCSSQPAKLTVTVNSIPEGPVVTTPEKQCSNNAVNVPLSATAGEGGSDVRWYNSSEAYQSTGATYTARNISATTTYYAATYNPTTKCESAKMPVEIVKNSLPAAPSVSCEPVCQGSAATLTASASGNTIKWFTADDEDFGTGKTLGTGALTATTVFKAAAYNEGTTCESGKVSVTATVNEAYNITDNQTACESYAWQGDTYTESGVHTKKLTSVAGCDSTVTLNLTINHGYNITRDTTVCDKFVWQGSEYTQSGTPGKTFKSIAGCDSVVTYNLTVLKSTQYAETLTLCSNQTPYIYAGTEITSAGEKTITLTNAAGCDSVITLTVVINPQPTPATLTTTNTSLCGAGHLTLAVAPGTNGTACRWYTEEEGGTPFQTGASYNANFTKDTAFYVSSYNANTGCESGRMAVNVTVNPVPAVPAAEDVERCGAGEVTLTATSDDNATTCRWFENTATTLPLETGFSFTRHFDNAKNFYVAAYNENTNCSSARKQVKVTINPIPGKPTVSDRSNCGTLEADLSTFVTYNAPTLRWYDADDNLLSENINLNATVTATSLYKVSGYNAQTQCESQKETLNITIHPTYEPQDLFDTVCQYVQYGQHGLEQIFDEAGVQEIVVNTQTVDGCDSIVVLHLYVKPQITNSITGTACKEYEWNGTVYTTSGVYDQTFTAANGCDSVVTLTLTVFPDKSDTISAEVCRGAVYEENGFSIETGSISESQATYTLSGYDDNGCEKTTALYLTIYDAQTTDLTDEVCQYEAYDRFGFTAETAEPGVYTLTRVLTTSHGCDSTVNLTLTVNAKSEVALSDEVCAGTTYSNHGFSATYATAGTYTLTNMDSNVHGCDSVTTLTLTVNPVYNQSIARMICENATYQFGDQILDQPGTYTHTFATLNGCDSTVTLTLTIGSEYRDTIQANVCEGGSYNQNGFSYSNITESFTAENNGKAANGCDSTTVLVVTVRQPQTTNITVNLCQGDVYNENDFNITASQSGDFTEVKNLKTIYGCDSTVTLSYTVNPSYSFYYTVNTCQSEEPYHYEASDIMLNAAVVGSYDTVLRYKTTAGCDSIITLTVNVLQMFETSGSLSFCSNSEELPYEFGGTQLSETGVYEHTFTSSIGCDSVVTLNFTVNEVKDTTINAAICLGETYNGNGFNLTPDALGTVTESRVEQCAATGCDSTVNLVLTVNPVYKFTFDESVCLGETFSGYGFDTLVETPGIHTLTHEFTTVSGCDSTLTLTLTVNEPSNVNYGVTLCQGEALHVHGFDTLITEVGTHTLTHSGTNIHGCDSTTTLLLTVNPTFSKDTTVSICDVDAPFLWNGDDNYSYDEKGVYEIALETVSGCDSIINLNLIVNTSYNRDTVVTICQGVLPYEFCDGYEFNDGGGKTVSLTTAAGCDSIIHLQLIVTPNTELESSATVCASELPYVFNEDNSLTEAGNYDIEETDNDGCKTITHFTLNVNNTYEGVDEATVCQENLPFVYGDSSFTESGIYVVHFKTVAHCDSAITLTLDVIPTAHGTFTQTVCSSDFPVLYAGQEFEGPGEYNVTIHRDGLCDSVVAYTLIKADEYLIEEQQSVCGHALPFSWRGRELEATGVYYDSLKTVNYSCDSVYKITLTVNPTETVVDDVIVLCEGESRQWRGMELSVEGSYSDTTSNETTGCYIIHTVNVVVNPSYLFEIKDTVCSDELPYQWRGQNITADGTHEVKMQTQLTGCDSIYRLVLTINQSYHLTENQAVCSYEVPYLWHGMELAESGTYYDTLTTVNGCDSTFTLNFTVNPADFQLAEETVCQNELPFVWRGHSFTASGTYHDSIPNTYGCTDRFQLNLTVLQSSNITLYDTLCQGGYYSANGFDTLVAHAGSMFLQRTLTNAAGCDSTVNIMLSVMPNYEFVTDESTCDNVPFVWRGGEYITAGTYYDSLTTQYGCDSVYVLNLTINPTYEVFVSDTALREHEYSYGENFVIVPADSGTFNYDIHYWTVAHCDSVIRLTLYVAFNYGIDDIVVPEFSFFPNPTDAVLNIRGERMRTVEVYSITGKLIYRGDAESDEYTTLNVINYPTGNYIIKVRLDDNTVVNGKIIIQRR